ncbi:MAG: alginate export family protein [Bdellovibrionales bacterium]|nr:alginate export family protein [Bdellovibrionales bacterium]
MRKLLALVSVLSLVQTVNAENNLTTSAEFRTRVQNDMDNSGNKDAGITQNTWAHRLKVNLDFNAGEKFSAHATLLHNSMWGQGDGTTDTATGERDGVADNQNMLLVNEAYGTWMLSDSTSLRFGRGSFTIADGSVLSKNEWEAQPYAFEGVLATHDMEFGRLSGFYVKLADFPAAASVIEDPEVNAYGLSLDVKSVPDFIKMLNVHVIQVNRDELTATTTPGDAYMRYGLTVGGDVAGLDYNVDYAMLSGEHISERATGSSTANKDMSSSMYDIKVGYTLADVMGLRVGVDYHSDTGSSASATKDEDYDSFFYEKHENAGAMDIFGWGNLTYLGVNVSLMPMDNTKVGVDYYMFSQTEKDGTITTGANGAAFATSDATKDALGDEIDLWASHKYDNGLETYLRYSMFNPGDNFKAATLEDTYSMIFLEAKMNF